MSPLFFYLSLYISVALFLVELRWPAAFFLFFLVFLFLYIPNLWTQLSLILKTTRIRKQFLLSVFVFIDSLAVSTLQDAGGYGISRQNNLELHLDCHTCWWSYFTLVCLWCGRTVGQVGGPMITWLPNFLGWVDYRVFPGYFSFVIPKTPLTQGWGNSGSPKVSIISNSRKSLKRFRVSCKKEKHHYNRSQPKVPLLEFISSMLFLVIRFFMLNNVPPCRCSSLHLKLSLESFF